ncbi:hypothetical protein BTH42_18605 [Burkholderia sp. SRS-W-2-2016]|nr:hypothetical protein BTH42_18605 [Burkholderia sp. SRS-W-2-2016]
MLPLKAGDKEPANEHGFKDAVSAPQEARDLFAKYKRKHVNIAVATGAMSGGLLVIDTDIQHGKDGEARLAALEAQHGALPATYRVRSGSGGKHRYFTVPAGVRIASRKNALGEGVDVKCEKGYVVAPPSITTSPPPPPEDITGPYTVEYDMPVAPAPAWLIDLLAAPVPNGARMNDHANGARVDNSDLGAGVVHDWSYTPENDVLLADILAHVEAPDPFDSDHDAHDTLTCLGWLGGLYALKQFCVQYEWPLDVRYRHVDAYSFPAPQYAEAVKNGVARAKFDSITPNGTLDIGALINSAKRCGWRWPKPAPRFNDASAGTSHDAHDDAVDGAAQADTAAQANGTDDRIAREVERLAAQPHDAMLDELAKMRRRDYEGIREKLARAVHMRASALDDDVRDARGGAGDGALGGHPLSWSTVEPWPLPVDGAALLDEIAAVIGQYVVCDQEGIHAAALWVLMTHVFEVVRVSPRLFITAPEKACGKTVLLEIIGELARHQLQTVSVTPAALFRVIELSHLTLLIDEADRIPRDATELHALLNSGHTRASATVLRTVGDKHDVRAFSTWAPLALAGIGRLSDTLMSRSIVVQLQRKLKDAKVKKLREAHKRALEPLRGRIARWATDNTAAVGQACASPAIALQALDGRDADNWETLLAIAHVAGGAWRRY